MELTFHGGNCIVINQKKTRVVIDDNLEALGLKKVAADGDILLFTSQNIEKDAPKVKPAFKVDYPGEYEVSNVSIQGIPARSHLDEEKSTDSVIYRLVVADTRICVLGHVYPQLDDTQLEAIGPIDVLFAPVGGNGYTLDGKGALSLTRKIEPKVVVPTHYGDKAIKFEVPQNDLEEALKEMSMEVAETVESYKPKGMDISENTRLVVISRKP